MAAMWASAQQTGSDSFKHLPTGKTLEPIAGRVGPLNSSPFSIALSPDGRYAALLHAGFGTQTSGGCQSISIFTFATNKVADFPDPRFCGETPQSFFVGLAFSMDGNHIYASVGSITDPTGEKQGDIGNAIAVYSFHSGKVTSERLIKIAPTKLASGKWIAKGLFKTGAGTAIPYPAGLAVIPGNPERLLIANNFSDSVILIDAHTGDLIRQFDLSTNRFVPSARLRLTILELLGRTDRGPPSQGPSPSRPARPLTPLLPYCLERSGTGQETPGCLLMAPSWRSHERHSEQAVRRAADRESNDFPLNFMDI